jgi:hypothetical protein
VSRVAWTYHGGRGPRAFSGWLLDAEGKPLGAKVCGSSPQEVAAKIAQRDGLPHEPKLVDARRLHATLQGEALRNFGKGNVLDIDHP